MSKKKVEVLFDEKTGKFIVHCEGFSTHEKEHELIKKLVGKLKAQGFDVEVSHKIDKPKLPESDSEQLPGRENLPEGGANE